MRNVCARACNLGAERACLVPKQYIHQHGAEAEKQRANAPSIRHTCGVNLVSGCGAAEVSACYAITGSEKGTVDVGQVASRVKVISY